MLQCKIVLDKHNNFSAQHQRKINAIGLEPQKESKRLIFDHKYTRSLSTIVDRLKGNFSND